MKEYSSVIILIRVPTLRLDETKSRIQTIIHYAHMVAYITPDEGAIMIKDNTARIGRTTFADVISRLSAIVLGPTGGTHV